MNPVRAALSALTLWAALLFGTQALAQSFPALTGRVVDQGNILSPAYSAVGIGIFCAPDGTTWATQNFGVAPGTSSRDMTFDPGPSTPIARTDPSALACLGL